MKKTFLLVYLSLFLFALSGAQIIYPTDLCNAGFSFNYINPELSSVRTFAFQSYDSMVLFNEWRLNDSVFSNEANPVLYYYGHDQYLEVCHTVHKADSTECKYCDYLFGGPYCSASFYWIKDSANDCNCVASYQFYLESSEIITSTKWYFGDGDSSDHINPLHAYLDSGLFNITLKIKTASGCESEVTRSLYISSNKDCSISYYTYSNLPTQYLFYSNVSIYQNPYDSSNLNDSSKITFFWDFGDGSYSGESQPLHSYLNSGYYTINLTVNYPDGTYCSSSVNNYFEGRNPDHSCTYSGTFYRNYGQLGFDALFSNAGLLYVKSIVPEIALPDKADIWFDYVETGDTIYYQDSVFRGVILDCVSFLNDTTSYPCSEYVNLITSIIITGEECSGSAFISTDNCQSFEAYDIIWSNGKTGPFTDSLCVNLPYAVSVHTPSGKVYNLAFTILDINQLFPSWYYTFDENGYNLHLPVSKGHEVIWNFSDGTIIKGQHVNHKFNSPGKHSVNVVVNNSEGKEVYNEIIPLSPLSDLFKNKTGKKLSIYPVPAKNQLNIKLPDDFISNTLKIKIIDYTGKIICSKEINSNDPIEISDFVSGNYLLMVITDKEIYSAKFFKE